jgi:hypothetical protein
MRTVKIYIEESNLVLQDLDKIVKQNPNTIKREYTGSLISFKDLSGNSFFEGDQFDLNHITDQAGANYTEENFAKLFFVKAGGQPATPKLDFLFLDAYRSDYDPTYTPDALLDGMMAIFESGTRDATLSRYSAGLATFIPIAGIGSIPFIPISQTTIFIHPTTFERYRFNGTTMEVYNDVDGVVPTWLKWIGELDASDGVKLIPYNQDEKDYLNYFNVTFGEIIFGGQTNNGWTIPNSALQPIINAIDGEGTLLKHYSNVIECSLTWAFVEIKQRVRGNPPKLISAETNVAGDKVILTFDKKMNPAFLSPLTQIIFIDLFITSNNTLFNSFELRNIDKNTYVFELLDGNTPIQYGNTYDFSYSTQSGNFPESLDFGILQPFENFPIVNNVPASPQLLDAVFGGVDNIAGNPDFITLSFDKAMSIINQDAMFTLSKKTWYYDNYDEDGNPIPYFNLDSFNFSIYRIDENDPTKIKISSMSTDGNSYPIFGTADDPLISLQNTNNSITGTDGSICESFTNITVTNNVPT